MKINKTDLSMKWDILVDPSAENDKPGKTYRDLLSAYRNAPEGTADHPLIIALKPGVYRVNGDFDGTGFVADKAYVKLIGLSDDARDVVIYDNRGAYQGARDTAASTVISITATGFEAENISFFNGCNVDLQFGRDESQNIAKRSDVETQAVALSVKPGCDKIVFKNCRIISLLDTMGCSSNRTYFENCYIQGTNDFIAGRGDMVFNRCEILTFSHHITAAFQDGSMFGTVFIDCIVRSEPDEDGKPLLVFMNKGPGPVSMIRCTIPDRSDAHFRWMAVTPKDLNYRYYKNVYASGEPAYIEGSEECAQELSDAQAACFNPFNLLCGLDGWNPSNTNGASGAVRVSLSGPAVANSEGEEFEFVAQISPASQDIPEFYCEGPLKILSANGSKVKVIGVNYDSDNEATAYICAKTKNGIIGKMAVSVAPSLLSAPRFLNTPKIEFKNSKAHMLYKLDTNGRADTSDITWFLSDDPAGNVNKYAIGVSRCFIPMEEIYLSPAFCGKYISAQIVPKHKRSFDGQVFICPPVRIPENECGVFDFDTDFINVPFSGHDVITPGVFSFGGNWIWDNARDGAKGGFGLLPMSQGAWLVYTCGANSSGMSLTLCMDPEKTAGQGFGSPTQHLDILIKYDAKNGDGVGLRVERTTENALATAFSLIRIENGKAVYLTSPVYTRAFRRGSQVMLKYKDGVLSLNAERVCDGEKESVALEAETYAPKESGIKILHNGTTGFGNRNLFKKLTVNYFE